MHYLGDGLPPDGEEAVRWFRAAAVRGVSASMYLLGECLLEGQGTRQNKAAAFGWFAAAGDLGHRSARERVLSAYLSPKLTAAENQGAADVRWGDWNEWMCNRYIAAAGRR